MNDIGTIVAYHAPFARIFTPRDVREDFEVKSPHGTNSGLVFSLKKGNAAVFLG